MDWKAVRTSDVAGGLGFLALGLAIAIYSPSLNRGGGLGGGTFPLAIGVLLSIAGLGVFLGAIFNVWLGSSDPQSAGDELDAIDPRPEPIDWSMGRIAPVLVIPLAIIVYALTVRSVGALVMNFAVVATVAWVWRLSLVKALLLGLAASAVVHGFFTLALGVPLPGGVLEEAIRQWI